MIKQKKMEFIKYGIIFVVTLLICQNFLQMHYSSDTYVLIDLGYMNYPQEYFLLDGRLISSIVCYLAGILNIPYNIYIVGMDFIGIIFIATSIYLFSKTLMKIINKNNIVIETMLVLASFVLILNQFTLEYLLFPESAVMCLGVLLVVISSKIIIENKKYKYIKSFVLLLLAGISYQGTINIFPVLVILLYIVKQLIDVREYKIKEKEAFIDIFKIILIVILILGIVYGIVELSKNILGSNQNRTLTIENIEDFQVRIVTIWRYFIEIWNKTMNMLPQYMNNFIVILTILLLIIMKTKKEMVLQYILFIFICALICFVPMFIFDTGPAGRVNNPAAMVWGISLIILFVQALNTQNKKFEKLTYILIIISFIINAIYLMQNITEHIAANKIDHNNGYTIKRLMDEYESETGNVIEKYAYIYDLSPMQYAPSIKPIGSMTERKLSCPWSIKQTLNYYTERDLERTSFDIDIYMEKYMMNYDRFLEEQIIFKENTIYMIVY